MIDRESLEKASLLPNTVFQKYTGIMQGTAGVCAFLSFFLASRR
jgi:hypothetical protein